ncbi:methylated-DNA--[protein]-cysteine S-methyltransferase [Streptomyces sp. HNM0575]|uniref:methylated-DNA--[protein]-cysteine S-methyltransferase n=1 Tax=Streptomyces sp. HNM0575 TaxID=2716338 RepID=UPI00145DB229|nr:methylated-DNA--[protein]-cysteine S-methyltransferase [Streptomyces sp. HNM0575]NLU74692.1 methylated-DNA--[protein]-cysteine S-methyltransferase [Streptomyces sp. HNM0575]
MSETTASTAARTSAWTVRDTPVGPLLLAATDEGLVQVVFHADDATVDRALGRLRGRLGTPPVHVDPAGEPVGTASGDGDPAGADGADSAAGATGAAGAGRILAAAVAEFDSYFRGELREFTVPLDWTLSGGFHEKVLRELLASVPYGATAGYQDLADRVGEPGAARAVGMAMGSNPLPVVVACHRIVERGGGLGGFGGGRETKRTLLALEGLLPEPLF